MSSDASNRSYILQGARALEFGQRWARGWLRDNVDEQGLVALAIDLAPAHVNCVRLMLGPVLETETADVLSAVQHESAHYNVVAMHDDPLVYGE